MARIVKLDGKGPKVLNEGEVNFPLGICTCGLSKNFPFCDGGHTRTEDEKEDLLYVYDDNGRVKID